MKIIYPNQIELPVSDPAETVPGFTISNSVDDHLQKRWKATTTGNNITFDFSINISSSALAIFGLIADTITISVFSDPARSILVKTSNFNTKVITKFGERFIDSIWMEYPAQSTCYATIIFDTTITKTIKMGIMYAGDLHSYPNPSWGFSNDLQEHATVLSLRNGAEFIRNKPSSKNPSGTLEIPLINGGMDQYWELVFFKQTVGLTPFPCLVVDSMTDALGNSLDHEFSLWARFDSFKSSLGKYTHSTVNFSLKQFL